MKLLCCAKLKLPTGEIHSFQDIYDYSEVTDELEDAVHSLQFSWEDGNYSCDCNKSLFLMRQGTIPWLKDENGNKVEWDCGDTIELVSLEIERVG